MRMFRMMCVLLALVLMLPGGMAVAEQPQRAMGRYVEVPLTMPGQGEMSFAQANGVTYAVGMDGEALFTSTDMLNWDQAETGHDDAVAPALGGVNGLMVGAGGALYLSSGWAMMDENSRPFIERIEGGASERVQLDQRLETGVDRFMTHMLPTGELLGLSDTEAYRFSQEGATVRKYAVTGGTAMTAHGNEMAVLSPNIGQLSVLDIESGQVLRILVLPAEAVGGLVGYDKQGALYLVCSEGIYRVNAGGTLFEQIVDGRLATLGKPSAYVRQLLFDAENNPVIAYAQGGGMSLIAYCYDEHVATEPGTVLSLFALYDNEMLREYANKFQQKYPDVMVDLIVALPEGTAITRDDAIRTLNTELLAGRGPDVLVLDGLPADSYIGKGVLSDLSGVVQPMIDSGELAGNLAGALGKDGAIPAVPTRFLLPSIWGDVDGIKDIGNLAKWAQENPDALPGYAVDIEPLIGTFYLSCAPAWVQEDGRVDVVQMEAFLTALKAIRGNWTYEDFVQETGWDVKAMMSDGGQASEWNPYIRGDGWNSMVENQGMHLMGDGLQKQLPYLLRGADSVSIPNGLIVGLKAGDFAVLPGQAEGCFVPTLMMGASKGSVNNGLALEFIAHVLGAAVQETDLMEGFPVNVKALDAAQAREEPQRLGWIGAGDWSSDWPDQARRDQLRGIIDELKTPVICDFTLYQMIVSESMPFFEGNMDAAQAAANVCAKANAYLSE